MSTYSSGGNQGQKVDEFRAKVFEYGLRPKDIIADGNIHRCPVEGKPRTKDGAYVLHPDPPVSGWYKNWRTGDEGTWTARMAASLSEAERSELARRHEQIRRQREDETKSRHETAAKRAKQLLRQAQSCPTHPYLESKGVAPCAGLKINSAGWLLVPVLGVNEEMQSLQAIDNRGQKRFLPGGRVKGGFFPIHADSAGGPLLICEGLATGLSLHQATGHTVFCAFNCGNLKPVASLVRERFPNGKIILCADDDQGTEGNPGRSEAISAAMAVGGKYALPIFTGSGGTDFNDLHQAEGLEAVKLLVENAQVPEPFDSLNNLSKGENEKRKSPTQAETLMHLAEGAELFHSPDGRPFATIKVDEHRETHPINGKSFKAWLGRAFYQATGKAPSTQAYQDSLGVLMATALYDGPERDVFTRIAQYKEAVYLDLGGPDWKAVRITAAGWEVVEEVPVAFVRPSAHSALPLPVTATSRDMLDLGKVINLGGEQEARLVIAWLLGALSPEGPYPILILQGEQGSGKSTTARMLKEMIDPATGGVRTMPRNEHDLMIAASNGWVLAFDNISGLQPWLSDALCRVSTGGTLSTRQLYSDRDEIILEAKRPLLLNGITSIAQRPDLADRSLVIELPAMTEDCRRTESELKKAFREVQPRVLGALLNAVSSALRNLDATELDRMPRMADFARWVSAAEDVLPWEKGGFMTAYMANRSEAVESSLESDPVAEAVREFMEDKEEWEGRPGELLEALREIVPEGTTKSRGWPKAANVLSGRLKRASTFLRDVGVEIERDRSGRKRTFRITSAKTVTTVTPLHPTQKQLFGSDDPQNGTVTTVTGVDKVMLDDDSPGDDIDSFYHRSQKSDDADDGDDELRPHSKMWNGPSKVKI